MASDVKSLRELAADYRVVSMRNVGGDGSSSFVVRPSDPGPHHTAVQLEWAAREIESLRASRDALAEALRPAEYEARQISATPHHARCWALRGRECDCYRRAAPYVMADAILAALALPPVEGER